MAQHVDRARRTANDLLADVRRAVSQLRATPDELPGVLGAITKPEMHLDDCGAANVRPVMG